MPYLSGDGEPVSISMDDIWVELRVAGIEGLNCLEIE